MARYFYVEMEEGERLCVEEQPRLCFLTPMQINLKKSLMKMG